MAISHDLNLEFENDDPGIDLGLFSQDTTTKCPLEAGDLDTTARPGWLRARVRGSCGQWSDRGDAAMILRGSHEDAFIETAVDLMSAWRAGAGIGGGTPTRPGQNGIDFGLVVYDKRTKEQVIQLTARTQSNQISVRLHTLGKGLAASSALANWDTRTIDTVWLRIERTSRSSRRFNCFFKTSATASWTRLGSVGEGSLRRPYYPWSSEMNDLQYGLLLKTFQNYPSDVAGAEYVADFDYIRTGQFFDDHDCPDRPLYYWKDAPSSEPISVDMTGLRHGMYIYWARVQAVRGNGTDADPYVFGPWSDPSSRFLPIPKPPPLMLSKGGNQRLWAHQYVHYYQESGDYKPRASGSAQLDNWPGMILGRTSGIANAVHTNQLSPLGSQPRIKPRANWDRSAIEFGYDNRQTTCLHRSNRYANSFEPGSSELTYAIVFRSKRFESDVDFLFAGGSRTGSGEGYAAAVWKDGSVGFRAVRRRNRAARRIPGQGHDMPQLMIAMVTWASSRTRCLGIRVNGGSSGVVNNGFNTVGTGYSDACTRRPVTDNGDGFTLGCHRGSTGSPTQGLEGDVYSLMVMREEINEPRMTVDGRSVRTTEQYEEYLARRFYLKCAGFNSPNVGTRTGSARGFSSSEACSRGQWNNGWCQETCASGTVLQMGSSRRKCVWGGWDAAHPVCARKCPLDDGDAIVASGATVCLRRLFSLNFDEEDLTMAGEHIFGMRARPMAPDYSLAKHIDLSSGRSARVRSLEPSCAEAPQRFHYAMAAPDWAGSVLEHTTTLTVTLHEPSQLRRPRPQIGVTARFTDHTSFYALEISSPPPGTSNVSAIRTVRIVKVLGSTETVLASATGADVAIKSNVPYVVRLTAFPGGKLRGRVHYGPGASTPIPVSARGAWWERSPELQAEGDDEALLGPLLFDEEVTDASSLPLQGGSGGLVFVGEGEVDDLSVDSPCSSMIGGSTCDNMGPFGSCVRRCGPGYLYDEGTPIRRCTSAGTYTNQNKILPDGSTQSLGQLSCRVKPPTINMTAPYQRFVSEGSPVNAHVGEPLLANVDSPDIAIEYKLTDDASGVFKVGRCTGQLLVARAKLDFETQVTHNLTVLVTAADTAGRTASVSINVTVVVLDKNEPPYWLPDGDISTLRVSLPENATVGQRVPGAVLQAADPDGEGEPIAYELQVAGPTRLTFVVDNTTGVVSVGPDGPENIDFESGEQVITLLARAFDPRHPDDPSLSTSRLIAVTILDSPDPPRITEPLSPAERYLAFTSLQAGMVAGDGIAAEDQDATTFTEVDDSLPNGTLAESLVLNYSLAAGGVGTHPTAGGAAVQVFDVDPLSGEIFLVRDLSSWYTLSSEDKGVSPSGRPYMDVFTGIVRVTDSTGLWDEHPVSLFVIANTSLRGDPTLSSVEIQTGGPFSSPGAVDRLATRGGDILKILGDNFATVGSKEPITLNLTMQGAVGGIVFATTDCVHVSPTELNCTAPAGIGHVRASVSVGSRVAIPASGASIELRYAPPEVSVAVYGDVDPFGGSGDIPTDSKASGWDGNLGTRGGDLVTLLGSSLGPEHPMAASYLTVRYGPPGDATRYSAGLRRVRMQPAGDKNSSYEGAVVVETRPGVGTDLVFSVEVLGDEESSDEAATSLSYERPVLSNVTGVGLVDTDALGTAGGEAVRLMGTGFGPPMQDGSSFLSAVYARALYGVTLGARDPTPDGFPALGCVPDGDSHTSVVCTTSPGTGARLGWAGVVEGQVTTPGGAPAAALDSSYAAPVVMEVFGPGASDADTRGGDIVSLRGRNFPPPTTLPTLLSAVYGPAKQLGRHTAVGCMPVTLGLDSVGVMTCQLAQGTGRDHQWSVTVDGQASPFTTDANTSYGAPVLSAFGGPGIDEADTAGTTIVTISGTNFGPNATLAGGRLALLSATYQTRLAQRHTAVQQGKAQRALGTNGTVVFAAADCVMTVAHEELRCRKTEGAGEGFAWSVVVDGQASGAPRTSYAAPSVSAVMGADGVSPALPADTAGGTVYTLVGSNFGPPMGSLPFGSLVQSVRFGASGSERAVRSWEVLSHTEMRVSLPPGLGSGLRFIVTVADQPSAMSPPFDYSPPVVLSVSPAVVLSSAPQSQRRIAVRGTSLGVVAAAGGAIYAAVGSPVDESDASVGDTVPLLPARSSRVLPEGEASVAGEQEVTVDIPAGVGPLRAVRIVAVPASESEGGGNGDGGGGGGGGAAQGSLTVGDARRQGASVSDASLLPTAGINAVNYTAPQTEAVIVSRPTSAEEQAAVRDALGSGSGASDARIVYVTGRGFGPSPPALYGGGGGNSAGQEEPGVRRQAILRIGQPPLVQTFVVPVTGPAAASPALRILAWSDTEVKLVSAVSQGEIWLQVATRDFAWRPIVQSTRPEPFSGLSPSISALEGAETPFPTTGGSGTSPLVIRAFNLANALSLSVKIGGVDAPLINSQGQPYEFVADTVEADIQRQFDAARGQGTPVQDILYTLRCIVPPGQGSSVPVVVERDANASAPSSASIAYAAPVLMAVSSHDERPAGSMIGPLPAAHSRWPSDLAVVVPTVAGVIRVEGTNLGPCPTLIMADAEPLDACLPGSIALRAGVRHDTLGHSWVEFPAPPGEGRGTNFNDVGPLGYQIRVQSGDQMAAPASVSMRYAAPTVLSVSGSPSPASGGVITLTGRDFGQPTRGPADGVPPLVEFMKPAASRVGVGSRPNAYVQCSFPSRDSSHTTLTCNVPPGTGSDLQLRLRVADLALVLAPVTFSYDRPSVASWSLGLTPTRTGPLSTPISGAPTSGGVQLFVQGSNFGAFDPLTSCVFVTWPAAPSAEALRTSGAKDDWWQGTQFDDVAIGHKRPAAPLSCTGVAEWRGEGEVLPSELLAWDDTAIAVTLPPGVGTRRVWVVAGGNAATAPLSLTYAAPSLSGAALDPPAVATDGSEMTTLTGASNLGPPVRDTSEQPVADAEFPLTIDAERMLPTAAVVMNISTVCAAGASGLDVSGSTLQSLRHCGSPARRLAGSGFVVSRSHSSLTLAPPVGVGTGHMLGVMVIENGVIVAASDPAAGLALSYRPPSVVSTDPSQLEVDGDIVPASTAAAAADTSGLLFSWGGPVSLPVLPEPVDCQSDPSAGVDASQAMASGVSHPGFGLNVQTKRLLVQVANVGNPPADLCDSSFLPWTPRHRVLNVSVGKRACTRAHRVRARGRLFVQCEMPNSPVGYHDISVFGAGQLGVLPAEAPRAMQVVCDNGYFGKPGELCLPCPTGATCSGYDADVTDVSDAGVAIVVEQSRGDAPDDPLNATVAAALAAYTDPRPVSGFFNLNTTDMLRSCPFSNRVPGRAVCVTPCEPKFACIGDNLCATGYMSTAPEYRCNSCAKGYYRRAGLCEECPDQPYLVVISLVAVAILAAVGAWWLNKVGGAISFIQIGVDYVQVLAIFASARFALPDALRDLFAILSALNLNIDIVAPECFIPDVNAIEKWFVFQFIPVAVVLVLCLSFIMTFAWAMLCKQRKRKEAASEAGFDRSVNLVIVFMYVLYLQSSKTSLDALACVPTDPPQTDEAGEVITYLQMVFEPCSKPGGVHQTLLPWAIVTLGVYSIGFPLFCAYVLYRHWHAIYLDQLLRAVGTGETSSTNDALWLRHRYGRVYNFFKPTRSWWILVLLARKFLIALITLWFSVNPAYQLAMTLLVLFVAFALQVRLVPFMSAPERAQVIVEHRSRAMTSPTSIDAKLKVTIDNVEARGRRRRTFARGLDASSARSLATSLGSIVVGSILVSANGVELTMLFSAVLVTLSGLLFESGRLDSEFYAAQRDSLTYFVIILVTISLIYFVLVLGIELHAIFQSSQAVQGKGRTAKGAMAAGAAVGDDAGGRGGALEKGLRGSARNLSRAAGFISAMAGSGAGGGTDEAVLKAAARRGSSVDESSMAQQANPMFAGGGGGGGGDVGAADASAKRTEAVADAFMSMTSPPDASQWVVFKTTMQRMQMRMKDLQSEVQGLSHLRSAQKETITPGSAAGKSTGRRMSTTSSKRRKFGQALIGGGGGSSGGGGGGSSGGGGGGEDDDSGMSESVTSGKSSSTPGILSSSGRRRTGSIVKPLAVGRASSTKGLLSGRSARAASVSGYVPSSNASGSASAGGKDMAAK